MDFVIVIMLRGFTILLTKNTKTCEANPSVLSKTAAFKSYYLNSYTRLVYLYPCLIPNLAGLLFQLIKEIILGTLGDTIAQFKFPDFSSKIDVLQKAVLQWSYFVHFRSNTLQSTWQGVHFQ